MVFSVVTREGVYTHIYTFALCVGQDNNFVREMDRHKVAQFTFSPDVAVPSLQELVCRFIAKNRRRTLSGGVLPDHLISTSMKT